MATILILIAFVIVLVLALVILIPVLATQLADFVAKLPEYLTQLQALITSFDPQWLEQRFGVNADSLREGLNSLLTLGRRLHDDGLPVDLEFRRGAVLHRQPVRRHAGRRLLHAARLGPHGRQGRQLGAARPCRDGPRSIATDINTATAGFVRGQGTLCLVLGVMYAVGLTLTGLNFGILIGLFAGLISFIPYVGSLVGLVLSVGRRLRPVLAGLDSWSWRWPCVFFVGQFIEGNILQPRLVGKSVGLHPVWLMFALFAFGALFGFVGLLIAVPAAAADRRARALRHLALSRIAALQGPWTEVDAGRRRTDPAARARGRATER